MEYKIPEVRPRMYLQEISAAYSTKPILNTYDAAQALQENFRDADREYLLSVNLDSGGRPISYSIISMGDTTSVHFPIAPVFKMALLQNAVSVIICHNHPGGNLFPSEEDCKSTRDLVAAGKMLGIQVLDHFILTPDNYLSMREEHGELF